MERLQVGEAAVRAGWSPRMLRYLDRFGLVTPRRTAAGYRQYGLRELNQLRSLAEEEVGAGAAFHYVPGTVHRITAVEDTTILEVSTPHLDDVVRLEDRYGREGTSDA